MDKKFNINTDFAEISRKSYWLISDKQKKCWDKDQMALFGSRTTKSSIAYVYIPAEFMEEGVPYIIKSEVGYDGGEAQKAGIANGDMVSTFDELKNIFTLNKF